MIINKVTIGFVVQSFDTDTQSWVSQEFVAGDEVSYEDELGGPADEVGPYLPFDMVQPIVSVQCPSCGSPDANENDNCSKCDYDFADNA